MFCHTDYTQTSVICPLKAEMSDGVAARPDRVGPHGRRYFGGLAIMNSGPVHLCGIKGMGDVFTAAAEQRLTKEGNLPLKHAFIANLRPDPIWPTAKNLRANAACIFLIYS